MNLLSRDGGRLVFHLTRREHYLLRVLLRLARRGRRTHAPLSRAVDDPLAAAAAEAFAAGIVAHHDRTRSEAEAWLKDPRRCIRGRGGSFGLTLTPSETETLLQAINAARVGAWESLGSPDFEMGERIQADPTNLRAVVTMGLAEQFVGELLRALHETD
ncbi:MAG: hypothetical protein DVB31_13385 [Verrucomicrobia bacterium]|nr:MAG: hypothetical protein DVB31_13385 [Verrucomicrobiota bacterium]